MPGVPLSPYNIPTSGDTWPTWSTKIIQCLTTLQSDLEAPVTTAEMLMNNALVMNNQAVTDARYFGCRSSNTNPIPTCGIGVKNGEWYITDAAGNEIQLTKTGTINVATTGGITGSGYGSTGVELNWNSGIPTYSFFEGTNVYADVRMDDLKLRNGTTSEVSLGFAGPASINQTLPSTNPAATALVSLDAAGQYAHNATVGTGVTFNNANITLTGTADVKHPTKERAIQVATPGFDLSSVYSNVVSNSNEAYQAILNEGERVIGVKFRFTPSASTVFRIYKIVDGIRTALMLNTGLTSLTIAGGAIQTQTMTLQTPYTYTTNETIVFSQDTTASGGACTLYHAALQFDRA